MTFEDDETLQMYVEESLEHLSHIENDLLSIEAGGADIDEDIVNNVFRAAHSIKGGAGFMGLTTIKELAHKIENILGMIRSREIVPSSEMISILLKAFDELQKLILNIQTSNEADISRHLRLLTELTSASLTNGDKESMNHRVDILLPNGKVAFTVPQFDINQAQKEGKFIYLVEIDLIHDIQRKNKTLLDVTTSILNSGVIIESKIDTASVGTLDDEVINRIPFRILFASIIEPDIIPALFEVDADYVHTIQDEMIRPAGQNDPGKPHISSSPQDGAGKEPPPEHSSGILAEPSAPDDSAAEVDSGNHRAAAKPDPADRLSHQPAAEGDAKPMKSQTSLRVNVSLLDALMTLAGELVLSRNQLLQGIASGNQRALEITAQRIDLVTSELQEAIMRTRMQALANVFNKFPRVVRDLAQSLGKEIELSIEGKNVELDKTIIEAINDPLTHLVRNAVDHGIEPPTVRRRQGKNPVGQVWLRAFHEAGQVNIEVSDDGAGLDGAAIASKAFQKGLITEQQVRLLSEKEKIALIFLPGFSTAETITDVSGRGVGMDVVKTNLDKLGGIVDIDSKVGEGTTIRVKLPLTLAIIPSQIIATGKERYAIPQVNLDELLRIPASQVKDRVEKVGEAEVVRLRGNLLPLLKLSKVLGIERTYIDPRDGREYPDRRLNIADRRSRKHPMFQDETTEAEPPPESPQAEEKEAPDFHPEKERRQADRRSRAASALNIAVVSAGAFKYGLVVDELKDSEEIVVKPLGRHLKNCHGYAGATIMGDGKVALILDVVGLAQMAGLTSLEGTDTVAKAAQDAMEAEKSSKEIVSLLLFRNAPDEQFAVPLNLVERIERIETARIESVGSRKVIQYRGGTLTLFGIEEVAKVKPRPERDTYEVIVFMISGREVGLLALPPVDAVETSAQMDSSTLRQPGIMGSMIIGNKTTLVVDMIEAVRLLNPDWFGSRKQKEQPVAAPDAAKILLVEDSDFFRSQLKDFLHNEGYEIVEATNGKMAWEMLEKYPETIKLMITDLEMPSLDGFELTSKIKKSSRFKHLPIIALTSLADEQDMEKGKRAGVDEYQLKLNREKLIESIRKHFTN